jgi:hypothetical protein
LDTNRRTPAVFRVNPCTAENYDAWLKGQEGGDDEEKLLAVGHGGAGERPAEKDKQAAMRLS